MTTWRWLHVCVEGTCEGVPALRSGCFLESLSRLRHLEAGGAVSNDARCQLRIAYKHTSQTTRTCDSPGTV